MSDFPGFDFEGAARRIKEENRVEDAKAAARRESAILEGKRIAAALRESDGSIRAIWGFGSTFESSRPYGLGSDIDIAIDGGDILRLLSLAQESTFKVDLVDITGQEDGFAQGIRERGTRL